MKAPLIRLAAAVPESFWDAMSPAPDCLLPYYHMVSDEFVPHVSPLYAFRSVAEFERDLEFLQRRRRAISLPEFLASFEKTGSLPPNTFLLTFDDGFREMHDVVAPILKSKGIPAVFFLTSATAENRQLCLHQKISLLIVARRTATAKFPDAEVNRILAGAGLRAGDVEASLRAIPWGAQSVLDQLGPLCGVDFDSYARERQPFLTNAQVKSLLRDGMDIGAHSIDHPKYADIPLAEQLRQTRESMRSLENEFALKRRVFAFPHTDSGVSMNFFATVIGENTVEATFGTGAPAQDSARMSFQRFSMEKAAQPAPSVLAHQSLRRLKMRLTGRTLIQRPSVNSTDGPSR